MSQLSGDAQRLVAQTRGLDEPSSADRDRLRARLDASWAAEGAGPTPRGRGRLWLTTTSIVALAGVGLWLARAAEQQPPRVPMPSTNELQLKAAEHEPAPVVQPHVQAARADLPLPAAAAAPLAATGKKPHKSSAAPRQTRVLTPSQTKAVPATSATPMPAAAEQASEPAPRAYVRAQPTQRLPVRAVDARPEAFAPDAIGDEVSLLGAAQRELRAGQPTRALGYIRQHEFRFPTGALSQERAAVHALALCALHRKSAALQVFEDLQRRAPSAAVLSRIRQDCGF